jgi:hypothetical protein
MGLTGNQRRGRTGAESAKKILDDTLKEALNKYTFAFVVIPAKAGIQRF